MVLIEINENDAYLIKIYLIEYSKKQDASNPFIVTYIENLNRVINLSTETFIDCLSVTALSNYLILCVPSNLLYVDLKKKELICTVDINPKIKIHKNHSVDFTNDLIALSNSSQLFYFIFDETSNTINTITNIDLKISEFNIMQHLAAVYDSTNSSLFVIDLDQVKLQKSISSKSAKLKVNINNLEYFSISPDCKYIATVENSKQLSLYRLKDSSKCASGLLYSRINTMIIGEKYISMAMRDRRVFSYLILDPLDVNHENRLKALPSR